VELRGAVALVTGGGAGLGRFIAERLVAADARVVVADLASKEGGSEVAFVGCDVRVPADVEAAIEAVCSRHGGLDLLVNNAGGVGAAHYPDASFASWRAILDLNLTGPMLATQLALEPMRARGGGAVVNIASSAGLGLAPYDSPDYGAAKAGLIRFTSTVASLRETMNVRVNCVVPDWIGLERAHAELAAMSPEEQAAAPPFVEPSAIADVVADLACDESLAGRVVVMRGGEEPEVLPQS
jgi:NAD(P)-dependent dehydrogenase (short-subunit alcohol dehydrogenase family)